MIIRKLLWTILFLGAIYVNALAQEEHPPENWFTLDQAKDGVMGTSADEALQQLKDMNKTGNPVVVAILDSGIEVDHEDLKDIIWVNTDEIPDNGVDDDRNGYIDDIHGWSFLGGKDGRNVNFETFEVTREYVRLKKRFEGADPNRLSGKDRKTYQYYMGVKEEYEGKLKEMQGQQTTLDGIYKPLTQSFVVVKKALGGAEVTPENVDRLEAGDDQP